MRRRFGSVIVKNDEIISTGYVGAPRGRQNCIDLGYCWRESHNIPSGERYEKCRSSHSEMNAIISASRSEMIGSTLYLVGVENDGTYTEADCCAMCKRVIINAGITNVVFRTKSGGIRYVNVEEWINNDDSLIEHSGY
jgi:dCMP deaminase